MPSIRHTELSARIAARLADFTPFQLDLLCDVKTPEMVQVWRVHCPRLGNIDSFEVAVLPSCICLSGDYVPGHNGVVSSREYSEVWFATQSSADYIAEKFLPHVWHADNARWWLADLIDDTKQDGNEDAAAQLAEITSDEVFEDQWRFTSLVSKALPQHEWSDSSPLDYDPSDYVALAVCQQVFARLWHARVWKRDAP